MTISQMRHFQAVCLYGNVTRAAESMHITQPSISNSIRELECEFGINLFHRINKRFSLTHEGEFFLKKVTAILEQVDILTRHMQDFGGQQNRIRIGVPPMIGTFLFPSIFDAFHDAHPEIEIEIAEHGSLRIRELVTAEELDVAISVADREQDHTFNVVPICNTHLLYCVAGCHPLADRKHLDLSDFIEEPIILFKDDSVQNTILINRFTKLGIQPQILLSSTQLYTIKKIISNGKAGAFLFREIAAMETDLIGIPLTDPVEMDICLIWKKDRHVYSDTAKFIRFVKTCYSIPR